MSVNHKIIKVCGMREGENIRALEESRMADWMGMIFYPKSPRYVDGIPSFLPHRMKIIGVFVNPSVGDIIGRIKSFGLSGIQLHGKETPDFIAFLKNTIAENEERQSTLGVVESIFNKLPECSAGRSKSYEPHDAVRSVVSSPMDISIIKAFNIACAEDLKQTEAYEGLCDYFLFDTPCLTSGGSGKRFDWNLLSHYEGKTPFLLSGGIGPDCIAALHAFHHPLWVGIDLNSRFETAPALKDIALLTRFCKELKEL